MGAASVLDQMTADTSKRKRAEGATLTPVGLEKPRIPDIPEVFLTQEAVLDIARDLRRQAAVLIDVAEGLERHAGKAPGSERTQEDIQRDLKLMEREADRQAADRAAAAAGDKRAEARDAAVDVAAFTERFAALSKEAQESAFAGDLTAAAKEVFGEDLADNEPEPASGSVVPGWVCPTHGDESIADLTSKRGRKYRACTICKQFEKE